MEFYAHTCPEEDGRPQRRQLLRDHLRNVSAAAEGALLPAGLGSIGALVGLLHDMGKYSDAFQTYLAGGGARGSVDHSSAGLIYLQDWAEGDRQARAPLAELAGYAIASHHGLRDCIGADSQSNGFGESLFDRKSSTGNREETGYGQARERMLCDAADGERLSALLESGAGELRAAKGMLDGQAEALAAAGQDADRKKRRGRYRRYLYGLLARAVLSALIDADWADTAAFCGAGEIGGEPDAQGVFRQMLAGTERYLSHFPAGTEMQRIRGRISDLCAEAAEKECGIYRLALPTGAGKTLSSLRFALRHALRHAKRRIFYVAPLLTILDQNADVIRRAVGPECSTYVLEHDSDVSPDEFSEEERSRYLSLTQTWDSPVVITTLVQLLNTMFSSKKSSVRRFGALRGSVVIIDEVQSVPLKLINMFNGAVSFLSGFFGCTVILSSATQAENCGADIFPVPGKGQLISLSEEELSAFRRTEIVPMLGEGRVSAERLAEFAAEKAEEQGSLLAVCNTKASAARLYREIGLLMRGERESLYFLSAGMCKAHRKDVLARMGRSLSEGRRTVCVSTQVVEAGVDISFACVIRLLAGIDSIAQAAGRCNRNGEYGQAQRVYVWDMEEKVSSIREISQARKATETALKLHPGLDILSQPMTDAYYGLLYSGLGEYLNCQVRIGQTGADLFDLLSGNTLGVEASGGKNKNKFLNQAFGTAGDSFTVFDTDGIAVVVPYGEEGRALIADLCSESAKYDAEFLRQCMRRARNYTVTLYSSMAKKLGECGAVAVAGAPDQQVLCLVDGYYGETGVMDQSEFLYGGI